jgi:hypothetical protein
VDSGALILPVIEAYEALRTGALALEPVVEAK